MATTSSNSPEHESKNDIHLTNVADPIAPEVVQVGSLSEVSNLDDVILQANGHEAAMKRQFKWLSALGLAFSITNSWVGYFVSFPKFFRLGGS